MFSISICLTFPRSISAPVLLLHGARDTDIQPWQAKANFLEALGVLFSILRED